MRGTIFCVRSIFNFSPLNALEVQGWPQGRPKSFHFSENVWDSRLWLCAYGRLIVNENFSRASKSGKWENQWRQLSLSLSLLCARINRSFPHSICFRGNIFRLFGLLCWCFLSNRTAFFEWKGNSLTAGDVLPERVTLKIRAIDNWLAWKVGKEGLSDKLFWPPKKRFSSQFHVV